MRRSTLFLPGNTPNMIINGDALGEDSIILDLEDAVSPYEKDAARLLVRSAIREMGFADVEITVRINSIDTAYWQDDLEAIVPLKPDLIMPPKASNAADMQELDAYIADIERRSGMPVGGINNTIEAVLYCKAKGIGAYQGGTCNETDRSAQVCVHCAMATHPDQILAKPGMGVDEGYMIVYNEMQRILAYEKAKKTAT